MQRRDFVTATTLGALAGVTGACGGAQTARLSMGEADDLLERLRSGRDRVRREPVAAATDPRLDRMVRLGLEALVVADVARSIPADAPLPEPLARELGDALPVLDRCVAEYGALLGGMPLGARRRVERAVRARPEAAMEVASWIDERARGVDASSRIKLRQLARQVATKARRQSMGAVIDDTVGKVERIVANKGGPVAFAREATASAMLASVWQALEGDGVPPPPGGSPARELDDPDASPPPPPDPTSWGETPPDHGRPGQQSSEGPGDPEIAVGATMMGAGVAVFGIITLIGVAVGSPALFAVIGATPGGTLVIVGLIVLIVGLAQNA